MTAARVLIVEDNRLLRWWMASSLENSGFSVLAPETVEQAFAASEAWPADLLVTDWHLGEHGDGFDVLERVRRTSPQLVAILISSDADEQLAQRARAAGFDIVIQKPFPIAEIVAAVRSAARQQEARQESQRAGAAGRSSSAQVV